jgi:hypothetical protein
MTSCSKQEGAAVDNTIGWSGVYNAQQGSNVYQVVVTKADNNNLNVKLKSQETGYIFTLATLYKVGIKSSNDAMISETGNVTEKNGVYTFTGAMSLEGNQLTLNGYAAINPKEGDAINFNFTGTKK